MGGHGKSQEVMGSALEILYVLDMFKKFYWDFARRPWS